MALSEAPQSCVEGACVTPAAAGECTTAECPTCPAATTCPAPVTCPTCAACPTCETCIPCSTEPCEDTLLKEGVYSHKINPSTEWERESYAFVNAYVTAFNERDLTRLLALFRVLDPAEVAVQRAEYVDLFVTIDSCASCSIKVHGQKLEFSKDDTPLVVTATMVMIVVDGGTEYTYLITMRLWFDPSGALVSTDDVTEQYTIVTPEGDVSEEWRRSLVRQSAEMRRKRAHPEVLRELDARVQHAEQALERGRFWRNTIPRPSMHRNIREVHRARFVTEQIHAQLGVEMPAGEAHERPQHARFKSIMPQYETMMASFAEQEEALQRRRRRRQLNTGTIEGEASRAGSAGYDKILKLGCNWGRDSATAVPLANCDVKCGNEYLQRLCCQPNGGGTGKPLLGQCGLQLPQFRAQLPVAPCPNVEEYALPSATSGDELNAHQYGYIKWDIWEFDQKNIAALEPAKPGCRVPLDDPRFDRTLGYPLTGQEITFNIRSSESGWYDIFTKPVDGTYFDSVLYVRDTCTSGDADFSDPNFDSAAWDKDIACNDDYGWGLDLKNFPTPLYFNPSPWEGGQQCGDIRTMSQDVNTDLQYILQFCEQQWVAYPDTHPDNAPAGTTCVCCPSTLGGTCLDFGEHYALQSLVSVYIPAGETRTLVLDSYDAESIGEIQMFIERTPADRDSDPSPYSQRKRTIEAAPPRRWGAVWSPVSAEHKQEERIVCSPAYSFVLDTYGGCNVCDKAPVQRAAAPVTKASPKPKTRRRDVKPGNEESPYYEAAESLRGTVFDVTQMEAQEDSRERNHAAGAAISKATTGLRSTCNDRFTPDCRCSQQGFNRICRAVAAQQLFKCLSGQSI